MSEVEIDNTIKIFTDTVNALQIDLKNDGTWPTIVNELLKNKDENFLFNFWQKLLILFINKEKISGYCHKGQIYWNLALLYLQKGDITNCLINLEKSVSEDDIRNPGQFSSSKGMLFVLKPLLFRYKDKKSWTFDKEINSFYESMDNKEKRDFAVELFDVHNKTAVGSLWVIKDDFFGFISDERKRKIVFDTYTEVRDIVMNTSLNTYYSCIFAMGSILEGMLDDLFERDNQKVWKLFHKDSSIQKEVIKNNKISSTNYNSGMTLGQKTKVLLLMAKHNKLPMPKQAILQMIILSEYRDLVHPRRSLEFQYIPNRYVASFLFTMISKFAGHWWPDNIKRLINK